MSARDQIEAIQSAYERNGPRRRNRGSSHYCMRRRLLRLQFTLLQTLSKRCQISQEGFTVPLMCKLFSNSRACSVLLATSRQVWVCVCRLSINLVESEQFGGFCEIKMSPVEQTTASRWVRGTVSSPPHQTGPPLSSCISQSIAHLFRKLSGVQKLPGFAHDVVLLTSRYLAGCAACDCWVPWLLLRLGSLQRSRIVIRSAAV
jgi:hypothetical protein